LGFIILIVSLFKSSAATRIASQIRDRKNKYDNNKNPISAKLESSDAMMTLLKWWS
jgi:hypothetical protein